MAIPTLIYTLIIILFTIFLFKKKYLIHPICTITKDLTGQVIIITGANTGIGKETAYGLAKLKATIIIACRDSVKSIPVVKELQEAASNPNIEFIRLDLADLSSIREFVEQFRSKYSRLDTLLNNAGVVVYGRNTTKDGFENTFGTNHLGHFYLTSLLLDLIEKSSQSRIINVSSSIHMDCNKINWEDIMYEKGYFVSKAYAQSKLANILFTKELQKRVRGKGIKVVSLHPGVVKTDFCRRYLNKWYEKVALRIFYVGMDLFGRSSTEGAQTTLYCALEDHEKLEGGMYYADCKVAKENKLANNEENWKRMWELSEQLIAKALK